MKILRYVDENGLSWRETWVQLLSELAKRGEYFNTDVMLLDLKNCVKRLKTDEGADIY